MVSAKKISILLPSLSQGGAERLHLFLADEWLSQGIEVEFVLMQAQGEFIPLLPAGATLVDLQVGRARGLLAPLARYLHRTQPDVLLVAMWPLTVIAPLAAKLGRYAGRVVISEHNNLAMQYSGRGLIHGWMLRASMAIGYRLSDARIGVSNGVTSGMAQLSGLQPKHFEVMYNPAAIGALPHTERPELLRGVVSPIILAVGTLKNQKRYDLLIESFSRIPRALGATLCILGDGPEQSRLERQIESLGLRHCVKLLGFTTDTASYYAVADVFVLSSDFEGFGNVIVEALEYGVPVVSTDCPHGPAEILENGKFGQLVPVGDVQALANAIVTALEQPADRAALRARAMDFSVKVVAKSYLRVLLQPDADLQTRGSEAA